MKADDVDNPNTSCNQHRRAPTVADVLNQACAARCAAHVLKAALGTPPHVFDADAQDGCSWCVGELADVLDDLTADLDRMLLAQHSNEVRRATP